MKGILFILTLFTCQIIWGEVIPEGIFRDNMVLQRNQPNTIFGTASTEKSIQLLFLDKTYIAHVKNGHWEVILPKIKEGGPFKMSIIGDNTVAINNILIGDVWLFTGQLNMGASIERAYKDNPEDFKNEIGNANIRFFKLKKRVSDSVSKSIQPNESTGDAWGNAIISDSLKCSALAYFFAKNIQKETGVPLGLLIATQENTNASCWVPKDVLDKRPEYKSIIANFQKSNNKYLALLAQFEEDFTAWKNDNLPLGEKFEDLPRKIRKRAPKKPRDYNSLTHPSGVFNGMIAPLTKISICGVISSQGEGDLNSFEGIKQYELLLEDLITSWRSKWNKELPFYFTQLPSYSIPNKVYVDEIGPWFRESQNKAMKLPNTGIVVLTDQGDKESLYQVSKKIIGERLANMALNKYYGLQLNANSPSFKKIKIKGNKTIISFNDANDGLVKKTVQLGGETEVDKTVEGFLICSKDKKWLKADAKIISDNKVEVWNKDIKKPIAVRYGWNNFPLCNLFNAEGLPVKSFRTDNFEPEYHQIDSLFVPGNTISYKAKGETGITYHVYVPRSYNQFAPKKPIIISFSPDGKGLGILNKLKAAAEHAGWILVGCDKLKNGLRDHNLEIEMEDEVLNSIFKNIPHDKDRIYLAGFSGGAMRSYGLTVRRPETFAGILAYGGWLGGPSYQDEQYQKNLDIAMINGKGDRAANGWQPIDTKTLLKFNANIKNFYFEGGHGIAPYELSIEAIRFLNSEWNKKHKF